jgi:hypothetical protein
MVMKRLLLVVVAIVGAGGAAACQKPTAEDCRQAVNNVRKLYGTENIAKDDDTEAQVRRCKGGSSKKAVACAIQATTLAELKACKFMGVKSPT